MAASHAPPRLLPPAARASPPFLTSLRPNRRAGPSQVGGGQNENVRIGMRGQVVDVDARNQRTIAERIRRREQRGLGQGLGRRNARRRDAQQHREPHEKQLDRPLHARTLRRPSDENQADVRWLPLLNR